jgi:hypothetical protein
MQRGKAFKNVICLGHLLDAKGIIVGKSIDHSNVAKLIEMIELQEQETKKSSSK